MSNNCQTQLSNKTLAHRHRNTQTHGHIYTGTTVINSASAELNDVQRKGFMYSKKYYHKDNYITDWI